MKTNKLLATEACKKFASHLFTFLRESRIHGTLSKDEIICFKYPYKFFVNLKNPLLKESLTPLISFIKNVSEFPSASNDKIILVRQLM